MTCLIILINGIRLNNQKENVKEYHLLCPMQVRDFPLTIPTSTSDYAVVILK